MKNRLLASFLLLLGGGSVLGCANANSTEPVLVPASGTVVARAPSLPTEPAPSHQWPAPNISEELELDDSGDHPTKLARPLPGAVPGRAAAETSNGLTGTGEIPGRVSGRPGAQLMIDQAGARITSALCERELACNNVGTGRAYGTPSDCQRRQSSDTQRALGPGCSKGVDIDRLDDCEREIRSRSCNFGLDSLERTANCRATALCKG